MCCLCYCWYNFISDFNLKFNSNLKLNLLKRITIFFNLFLVYFLIKLVFIKIWVQLSSVSFVTPSLFLLPRQISLIDQINIHCQFICIFSWFKISRFIEFSYFSINNYCYFFNQILISLTVHSSCLEQFKSSFLYCVNNHGVRERVREKVGNLSGKYHLNNYNIYYTVYGRVAKSFGLACHFSWNLLEFVFRVPFFLFVW